MQLLVAGACGALLGFSFYLGSKIVNKYFKRLENSQWKNFVSFSIGSIIVATLSLFLFYIFLKPSSWKIFQRADIKTQVLEKRILELENKLNTNTTTNSTSTFEVNTTTTPTIDSEEEKVVKEIELNTSAPEASEPDVSSDWVPAPGVNYDKYRNPVTGKIMTPTEYVDYYDKKCASQNKLRSEISNSDGTISCITYTQACQTKFGANSMWDGEYCKCASGYTFSLDGKQCIPYDQKCKDKYGLHSMWDGIVNSEGLPRCGCAEGYAFYGDGTSCQPKQTTDYNNAPYRQDGNAYSPEQLNAMDCASYGINCPTINVKILN